MHELLLAPADAFKTGEKEFWVDDYSTLTEDSLLDDGNAPPPEVRMQRMWGFPVSTV